MISFRSGKLCDKDWGERCSDPFQKDVLQLFYSQWQWHLPCFLWRKISSPSFWKTKKRKTTYSFLCCRSFCPQSSVGGHVVGLPEPAIRWGEREKAREPTIIPTSQWHDENTRHRVHGDDVTTAKSMHSLDFRQHKVAAKAMPQRPIKSLLVSSSSCNTLVVSVCMKQAKTGSKRGRGVKCKAASRRC